MTHSKQRPPDTPRVFRDLSGQWHYIDRVDGSTCALAPIIPWWHPALVTDISQIETARWSDAGGYK